ncbi:MAG: peptidoglycan editing factor PgeF, partial [Gammaproteobacteria bacterium]|nr:peptidoglycan editing factor PgeF [Gammaproteobacteria bacterium]NNJ83612.1 peptidoglycan editing factor PgeF [Gammaproteobacteria bacterium]
MDTVTFIEPNWPAPVNVRAYTTTRFGGVSKPPWDSLNLAIHVGDAADAVAANRAILMQRLDLPTAPHWINQVHGNAVADLTPHTHHECIANGAEDASIAKKPNHVCAVLTADCLPVLFCDKQGSRVGAAHAGWRGLVGGVLEATVKALEANSADLLVWLGPAIGPTAFEVGDEVRTAFVREQPEATLAFSPAGSGHWLADLYELARQRLQRLGIRNIYG